eukprot:14381105-Alexandrium_andersonii.AAC.1
MRRGDVRFRGAAHFSPCVDCCARCCWSGCGIVTGALDGGAALENGWMAGGGRSSSPCVGGQRPLWAAETE